MKRATSKGKRKLLDQNQKPDDPFRDRVNRGEADTKDQFRVKCGGGYRILRKSARNY